MEYIRYIFWKHLLEHKKNQQNQEVEQDNNQQGQLKQSKIYIDENMADEIVNILNNINKQQ